MPIAADSFFQFANYAESVLWFIVGAAFALAAGRRKGSARRQCLAAAVLFVAFGGSDIVETQTGAWWRPWWLFAWKAACVLGLVALLFTYWRDRRLSTPGRSDGSTEPPVRE